jgi:iron complex transport system permease protein
VLSSPLTRGRIAIAVALCALVWTAAALAGLAHGSSEFGGIGLAGALLRGELDPVEEAILWHARLPRVFFASIVGAALATAGAVFQAVLRNPLADPYILGISGGAALGGTLLITLGSVVVGSLIVGVPAAAFLGAMAALAVIFFVERWVPAGRGSTYVLLLTGVIVNAFAASVIMFLKSIVSAQKAQELLFYLMGSLAVEGTPRLTMILVATTIAASLAAILYFARDLNVMTLGDDDAAALGVDVPRLRWIMVLLSSVAVAVAVAYSGIIGFVGLVVPHAVRLVVGPDHRILLPLCALGGAAFLTFADLLARSAFGLFDTTLPVGVITSMIGAPLFLYFLWRSLRGAGGLT